MQFPYGLSDFATLIDNGYWYQDRTDRIPELEAAGRQLIFLRPRRFGKSLLLEFTIPLSVRLGELILQCETRSLR